MVRNARWFPVVMLLAAAGCTPERLFPDKVGMGVARLTMRTAGNIIAAIEADTACGFSSQAARDGVQLEGTTGDAGGTATWTVTDCQLDFGGVHETDADCNGDKTLIGGRVRVSATKKVRGILTGNPANPAVPESAEAAEFVVTSAVMEGFQVLSSASSASMMVKQGSLSFRAAPHLAVSSSLGVCAVATPNLTLADVTWDGGKVSVTSDGRTFDTDVPTSSLQAQVGAWAGRENELTGSVTVWTNVISIPTKQTVPLLTTEDSGLDPAYDAARFVEGFSCTPDLQLPATYECGSLTPKLAEGAARLSVAMFGNIVSMTDADVRCGFASALAGTTVQVSGETGRAGGSATWTITVPCVIDIPTERAISTDCNGVQTLVSGRFSVTGTKTVRGIVTGDPAQPVIPTSRDPAEIALTADLTHARLAFSNSHNALKVESGRMTGTIRPRVAKDVTTGACSISTPTVEFRGINLSDAQVLVTSDGNSIRIHADSSALDAQNGTKDQRTNFLDGTISVGGQSFQVPLDRAHLVLDPAYDVARFDTGYACTPNMRIPATDAECLMTPTFAEGASRLTLQNFGTVVSMIDADGQCGFSSPGITVQTTGTVGERGGMARYTITTPCVINIAAVRKVSQDCSGGQTHVVGKVSVTGTKTLRGYLTGDPLQPIVPVTRDPAEIVLHVVFDNFRVTTSGSSNSLTWKSGSLDGTVRPRVAVDTTSGACAIATPVAELADLRYHDADITLHAGPKSFLLHVNDSSLNGVNGNKETHTNWLNGTITVDGTAIAVPLDPARPVLNPDYNQQTFDASYACTPNMRVASAEADCNFTRVLAENASRLFIQTAGTLTTMVNLDSSCGFEALLVKASPDQVVGNAGQQGSLHWSITDCELGYSDHHRYQTDCKGGQIMVDGRATMDAQRTVTGVRETLLLVLDSIRPDKPDSVEVKLNNVHFQEFAASYNEPGTGQPAGLMVIHSGQFSSTVRPYLGERASDPGLFDVALPIPYSTSNTMVQAYDLSATIHAQGKQFNVRINSANVDGLNGLWRGRENSLRGTITVDGQVFPLGDIPLKPGYSRAAFPEGYMCTNDLRGPIPPG